VPGQPETRFADSSAREGWMVDSGCQELPGQRILIVESEPDVARILRVALTRAGYSVQLAHDAKQGLCAFEPGKFAVITTTFELPRMDGLRLARAIKDMSPDQPMVLISGYAGTARWTKEELRVFNAVLSKPFTLAELMEAIDKARERPGRES